MEAALAAALATAGWDYAREPRRRRVLRAQDRPAHDRLDRPQLADGHDPARRLDAPAPRRDLHDERGPARAPVHDPPRAVRLLRALHRHPHRALRRRVPALARAGAGRRAAAQHASCAAYADEVVAALRARGPARRAGRARGEGRAQDPRRRGAEGAGHARARRARGRGAQRLGAPPRRRRPGRRSRSTRSSPSSRPRRGRALASPGASCASTAWRSAPPTTSGGAGGCPARRGARCARTAARGAS